MGLMFRQSGATQMLFVLFCLATRKFLDGNNTSLNIAGSGRCEKLYQGNNRSFNSQLHSLILSDTE